ncbi:MAG: cytochrome c oxidase assembly protein [Stellaceae bacterium]
MPFRAAWHSPDDRRDGIAYGAILAIGASLFWLSTDHPSLMPVWAPWDFSPTVYLATTLTLFWFWRGLALAPTETRPPLWRRIAFLAGFLVIYTVLQTRFEYWSQHMFFLNRAQHVVMHHIGPFLIALGGAGPILRRGMPHWTQRVADSRAVAIVLRVIQQPFVAAFLFVGLFYFWLIPAVHFRAMIDARLYAVMNWSMVLDGILFWCLVLDPRPKPPAQTSYGLRAALAFGVMFPQILLGAVISFSQHDLYAYYDLCGRLFPSIGALTDQHIGGIVSWIPPAMMSVVGVLVVLNALRIHEESAAKAEDEASASMAALASRWTGR